MSERQAAITSVKEYNCLLRAFQEKQQAEWEKARWTAYSIFSPFVKNGPKTPKAWVRFPWEQSDVVRVVKINQQQENRLNELYRHFMSIKGKLRS